MNFSSSFDLKLALWMNFINLRNKIQTSFLNNLSLIKILISQQNKNQFCSIYHYENF